MLKMEIKQRGLNVRMTQQMLQRKKVDALFKRVRGEAMPQCMHRNRL